MAVFTVHVPGGSLGERPSPERIVFLRDGFSAPAFLFGPFWLVWRRAWIPAALWTGLLFLLAVGKTALGLSAETFSVLEIAAGLMLGFEGSRFVAWSLGRRGYAECAVLVADNLDEAEEVFFANWPQGAAGMGLPPRPPSRGGGGAAAGTSIVGGLIEEPRP
jgi:hypothetical protein